MAIPLSNEMKEVRAPRTANLQAVNPMPAANQMAQAQSSFMGALGQLGENAVRARQRYDKSEDAFKRNEAERIYNERTTELNTQLAQKQGEDRIKFQPKYEAEMKQASDVYRASINKIGDFEIREGSKRHINAWNQRNASNYQYENYKNETNLQQETMAKALLADNEQRVNAITAADNAASLTAYANDPNLGFAHGEQMIRDFYKNRMGLPDSVVDYYVKDYKSKAAIAMANRLAQVTDDVSTTASYNQSLKFLDTGIKEGWIAASEGIEAKRTLESQKIDMVAAIAPGSLINSDGTYNFNAARKYAPDLTQKELYQHISNSKGKGAGNATAGTAQTQIAEMAKDNWNALTMELGIADRYSTEDFKNKNEQQIAQQKPATNKEILNLLKLYTYGHNLMNGIAIVNEDGTYTDPNTGVTTQVARSGVKRILDRPTHAAIKDKLDQVEADMALMINTGKFKKIFNPTVMKESRMLDDESRAYFAQMQLLMQSKGGPSDGFLSRTKRKITEGLGIAQYEATPVVTIPEMRSALNGVRNGIKAAQEKYGFDPRYMSDDLQMRRPVWAMQYNEKGELERIPGQDKPTNMATVLSMEIGYATLQEMDDGMFKSIYGNFAQKPTSVADMPLIGGWDMDFNGNANKMTIANKLNNIMDPNGPVQTTIGNMMFPYFGTLRAKAFEKWGPKNTGFSFTDAEAVGAFAKAGSAIKKALKNTSYTGTQMPDKQFQDMQILDTVFSGKPNNEPLTYDEFSRVHVIATPEAYNGYLMDYGNNNDIVDTILSVNSFSEDMPAKYFMTEKPEAMQVLDDMYAMANGQAPSNLDYLDQEIDVQDVFAAGGVHSFNAPKIAFGEAKVYANESEKELIMHGQPLFFVSANKPYGYVLRNNQIKKIDCNAFQFVSLLGIAKQASNEMGKNLVTKQSGSVPVQMISNQFKLR
jgi:hypothetical protein